MLIKTPCFSIPAGPPRAALLLALLLSWVHGSALSAQSNGPLYYAIENLDNGVVLQRGVMTAGGLPGRSLILGPNTRYREWLLDVSTMQVGMVVFRTPSSGRAFSISSNTWTILGTI